MYPYQVDVQTSHQNVEQFLKISTTTKLESKKKHMSETLESANISLLIILLEVWSVPVVSTLSIHLKYAFNPITILSDLTTTLAKSFARRRFNKVQLQPD
jgi:hypothetical protein